MNLARIVITAILLMSVANAMSARAMAGTAGSVLESAVARYLMLETAEGTQILGHLSGHAVLGCGITCREEALKLTRVRLESVEMTAVRSELEARIARLEEQTLGRKPRETAELSADEQLLIKVNAPEEFRINGSWRHPEGGIEFLVSADAHSLEQGEEAFVAREKKDPAFSKATAEEPKTPAQRKSIRERLGSSIEKMKECRRGLADPKAQKINYSYLLKQLAVDETMTVVGKVVAAGSIDKVQWNQLPRDLLFEAFSSAGGSRLTWMPGSFKMRWFRLSTFNVASQAAVDSVVYVFTPNTPATGVEQEDSPQADLANWKFYATWSAVYPPFEIAMYELIMGLECLYPTGKGAKAVLGFQLASGLATNVAYFGLQEWMSEKK